LFLILFKKKKVCYLISKYKARALFLIYQSLFFSCSIPQSLITNKLILITFLLFLLFFTRQPTFCSSYIPPFLHPSRQHHGSPSRYCFRDIFMATGKERLQAQLNLQLSLWISKRNGFQKKAVS